MELQVSEQVSLQKATVNNWVFHLHFEDQHLLDLEHRLFIKYIPKNCNIAL